MDSPIHKKQKKKISQRLSPLSLLHSPHYLIPSLPLPFLSLSQQKREKNKNKRNIKPLFTPLSFHFFSLFTLPLSQNPLLSLSTLILLKKKTLVRSAVTTYPQIAAQTFNISDNHIVFSNKLSAQASSAISLQSPGNPPTKPSQPQTRR